MHQVLLVMAAHGDTLLLDMPRPALATAISGGHDIGVLIRVIFADGRVVRL